jgi:PAS domain S-box-containing protein
MGTFITEDLMWRILHIDDDEDDYILIKELLADAREGQYSLHWEKEYQAGLNAIASNSFDAILVDHILGKDSGLELIRQVSGPEVRSPIILLTGKGGDKIDLEALGAGAADYLDKNQLTTIILEKSIRYAIEHKKSEDALRQERARLEAIIENAPVGILFTDPKGNITLANPFTARIFKGGITETVSEPGAGFTLHHPDGSLFDSDELPLQRTLQQGVKIRDEEILVRAANGHEVITLMSTNPMMAPDGSILGAVQVVQDITERRQAERALQEAQEQSEWMARFPEENPNPILRVSADRQILYRNPAATKLQGWAGETGQPINDTLWQMIEWAMDQKGAITQDLQFGDRYFSVTVMPILKENYANLYGRDITERVQAEQALQESETRERAKANELTTIMDTAPAIIWISRDPECREIFGNRYGHSFLKVTENINLSKSAPEEVRRQHPYKLCRKGREIPPEELPMQIAAAKGLATENYELDLVFTDGTIKTIFGNVTPLMDQSENPYGALGTFIDITERKKMEAETIQNLAQIEVQRRLIRQREMERLQIARSLHDGPFQTLHAANMSLMDAILQEERPDNLERLKWVQSAFDQQIREFREFIQELRPPALVSFGLETTIRSHLTQFHQLYPNIKVELNLMNDGKILPEETRLAVYRIYQELMSNVGKHSNAKRVMLSWIINDQDMVLEVNDDGVGFEVPAQWAELALSDHIGLIGIRERAEMIKAKLEIQSEPGKGTSVRVRVPREAPTMNSLH